VSSDVQIISPRPIYFPIGKGLAEKICESFFTAAGEINGALEKLALV
jgi:hypothetical protein